MFSTCGASAYLVLSTSVRISGDASAQLLLDGSVPVSLDWATC